MECEVGRKLAEAFAIAARQYANTVAKLGRLSSAKLDTMRLHRDEDDTLRLVRDALREAEAARVALETHIEQHRCGGRNALAG